MNERRDVITTRLLSFALTRTVALAQTSDADTATARDLAVEGYICDGGLERATDTGAAHLHAHVPAAAKTTRGAGGALE